MGGSGCTVHCTSIGNYNAEAGEDPAGVEIKVITYSGRDSDTMPPVWVAWLDLHVSGEIEAIETPIGFIPRYEDLKGLFAEIDKHYPRDLYEKQFAVYVDNIIARIDLQGEAYKKEKSRPSCSRCTRNSGQAWWR